jgi:hypothetical protein
VRRLSVWGILILVGVLSASHYKVSLLPARSLPSAPRQEDPRPSRGELPRSSILTAAIEANDADWTDLADDPRADGFQTRSTLGESPSDLPCFTCPGYLQPQIFRAHSADLPPPSPLLRRS